MSKISPKTLRIVYCATFIAIAVVVGSFLSFYLTESIKFNLAPVVIMLTGAVLGPIWGAAAGGVTALAGRPVGGQLHHAGLRQRLVQLFGRGVAKRAARLFEQYPFRA